MWARRVRHRAKTAATRATRGRRGLTCGPVLSVGGAHAKRELGGEAKQAERSVGKRAAGDARGLASAGSAGGRCTGLGQTWELRVARERVLGFGAWGSAGLAMG